MWLHGYLDLTYLGDLMAYNENKPKYLFSSSSQHIIFPISFTTNTTIEHDFLVILDLDTWLWSWHLLHSCHAPWHFTFIILSKCRIVDVTMAFFFVILCSILDAKMGYPIHLLHYCHLLWHFTYTNYTSAKNDTSIVFQYIIRLYNFPKKFISFCCYFL